MAPPKLSLANTFRIIKQYKENPCLYRKNHENYNDATARRAALESIRESMGIPNATVEDIRRKLKSLRSTFMQEYKKVKNGQETEEQYIPRLIWYQEMASFIPYDPETSLDEITLNYEELIQIVRESGSYVTIGPSTPVANDTGSQRPSRIPPQATADESGTTKRKMDHREINESVQEDNEDDILIFFAQFVTSNLRKVTRDQYFHLKKKIQNILYRYWNLSKSPGSPMRKKTRFEHSSSVPGFKVLLVKDDEYEAFSYDLVHQLRSLSGNLRLHVILEIVAEIVTFRTGGSANGAGSSKHSIPEEKSILQEQNSPEEESTIEAMRNFEEIFLQGQGIRANTQVNTIDSSSDTELGNLLNNFLMEYV